MTTEIEATTTGKFRSVVFVHPAGAAESDLPRSIALTVGRHNDSETAWQAALEASRARDAVGHTVVAEAPASLGGAGGKTAKDAEQMLAGIRSFIQDRMPQEEARALCQAVNALEETLVRGWSEVDEALVRISAATRSMKRGELESATELISTGAGFLHRWQGREGRIGNAC